MNKFIDYLLNRNVYGLFLKVAGFGFQIIGVVLIFMKRYQPFYVAQGMSAGLIFIGLGEIIDLLDKNKSKLKKNK